jgi:hypothetical protein
VFLKELKCSIQSGESVVLCDFAENYSFVLQDEARGVSLERGTSHYPSSYNYLKKSSALNEGL